MWLHRYEAYSTKIPQVITLKLHVIMILSLGNLCQYSFLTYSAVIHTFIPWWHKCDSSVEVGLLLLQPFLNSHLHLWNWQILQSCLNVDATIKEWKWLFMNGCKCKSQIYVMMELVIIVANPQNVTSLQIPQKWRSGSCCWWVAANTGAQFLPHWNF